MRMYFAPLVGACAMVAALGATPVLGQGYRIERVASGLNQPTFLTQAPGDPANILYFSERTQNANPGFNAANQMGKIIRYDVNTRTKTTVLDLSARGVTADLGLQNFAFHPDFNVASSAGFGKMYVSSATNATNALNRVEEYSLSGNTATLSRTILQYNNSSTGKNHTVNWIGFNTAAAANAVDRNYLHISTGDGNADQSTRPSQNPLDLQGKILRVDVSSPVDSYPADANKNFFIPVNNPFPSYNAANPANMKSGLGEVYITGVRNASRSSFDRATGDLYIGDVGENTFEELNFVKAGSTTPSGLPIDLGWPAREGTNNGRVSPYPLSNPTTGVLSTLPIRQYGHSVGQAIIAGYRYRGPVEALKDKVFYGDYVALKTFMLEFDRNTAGPFTGANGTVTDMTALWDSLIVDPTDPNYTRALVGDQFGIGHMASYAEDNAGNLYIIDMGFGTGFNGQYPGTGLGEIFRITAVPEPTGLAIVASVGLLLKRRNRRA